MTWIDTVVVSVVVVVGLIILYKALKEPLDMLGRGIARLFAGVRDKFADSADRGYEVIQYG